MSKEKLIQHLITSSKTESWKDLAKKFSISNGNIARHYWRSYIKKLNKIENKQQKANYIADLEDKIVSLEEDIKTSKATLTANVKEEIRTLDELIEKCRIDTNVWKIDKYIQNYWGNIDQPHWQVKAFLSKRDGRDIFQAEFMDFLGKYSPGSIRDTHDPVHYDESTLILNKQDSHLNKFDVNGSNNIHARFRDIEERILKVLKKASLFSNLKVKYIIGSDEFNSEWTQTTTKGTPQKNILPFHEAFELICNHEVAVIDMLLEFSNDVEIIYIPGNHDEYVGWHLINWLQAFYRFSNQVVFDSSPAYTKYYKFNNSAVMLNHGNDMKPQKLAQIFPLEFRDQWSSCEHFYIFCGDKHKEINADFNGIKFYGIPALSNTKSEWDSKMGHVGTKAELTAFLISPENGISDIYKEVL